MTLAETVELGRLPTLKALSDRISIHIDTCRSGRDLAALARRLMDVLDEIDAIERAGKSGTANGLSDFQRRLHEREQGKRAPRRRESA